LKCVRCRKYCSKSWRYILCLECHFYKYIALSKELLQGWQTYGMRKDFLVMWHSLISQFFYVFYPTSISILWRIYMHIYTYIYTNTHISDRVEIVCELHLLPNNSVSETFTQIGSSVKCQLDIYCCGTSLAVTGWISGIGWKVLQSPFQTGNGSSPSYFQIFFLVALHKVFIRNIRIILCINK
jgi:hypothetical protein